MRWSVQNAKAKLSELLALARAGKPQHIGIEDSCVVVSEEDWAARNGHSLGAWLVESAPRGSPLPEVSRVSRRGNPFVYGATQRKQRRKSRHR